MKAGQRMPDEVRARIAQTMVLKAEERIAQEAPIERKRCTRCLEWKDADEFTTKRRKLKSGRVRAYLASACSKCEAERTASRRAGMSLEERREETKRHHASRDKELQRRSRREWWREKYGKGVRVSALRRGELNDLGPLVDVAPLAECLRQKVAEIGLANVAAATRSDPRALHRILGTFADAQDRVHIGLADEYLISVGEDLAFWYPEDDA